MSLFVGSYAKSAIKNWLWSIFYQLRGSNMYNENFRSASNTKMSAEQALEALKYVNDAYQLAVILNSTTQYIHEKIYQQLAISRLQEIICRPYGRTSLSLNIRDIAKEHYPALYKKLGYSFIAGLISSQYVLTKIVLPYIPESMRYEFLKNLVGMNKIRGYTRTEEEISCLFQLMPLETHEQLKIDLFLYKAAVKFLQSDVPLHDETYQMSEAIQKEYYPIHQAMELDQERIIGISGRIHRCSGLVIYNHKSQQIENFIEYVTKFTKLSETTFILANAETMIYLGKWDGNKLTIIHKQLLDENIRIKSIISVENQGIILGQRKSNGSYLDWYIYRVVVDNQILGLRIIRELAISHDQHNSNPDQLTLLADKNTLLAWNSSITVAPKKQKSSCFSEYQVALINLRNFAIQTVTLPIETEGKMHDINIIEGRQLKLVIEKEDEEKLRQYYTRPGRFTYSQNETRPKPTYDSYVITVEEISRTPRYNYNIARMYPPSSPKSKQLARSNSNKCCVCQ